jgi:hypothetical protein
VRSAFIAVGLLLFGVLPTEARRRQLLSLPDAPQGPSSDARATAVGKERVARRRLRPTISAAADGPSTPAHRLSAIAGRERPPHRGAGRVLRWSRSSAAMH